MTENDIRGHAAAIASAVVTKNEAVAIAAGLALATQVLVDWNRIASALEKIANKQ